MFVFSYRRLAEVGIIYRERLRWIIQKPECLSNADLRPIGIEQASSAFLLLAFGASFSFFILCLEILKKKYFGYLCRFLKKIKKKIIS